MRRVEMGAPGSRAGAHSSDGMHVDTHWHCHGMHQLLYAIEGSVEVEGSEARYKVPPQYAVWIPAGNAHRTRLQGRRSGSIFLSSDLIAASPSSVRVIAVPPLMREMIIHAMRWPIQEAVDEVGMLYFRCFASLCGEWLERPVELILPAAEDERLRRAIDITERHSGSVTLANVCKEAGMSERSFRRHFAADVGITWEEYRRRLRIFAALEALDRSDQSIGSIAATVGYESQAAFAKAFRLAMGVTPQIYRRSRRP